MNFLIWKDCSKLFPILFKMCNKNSYLVVEMNWLNFWDIQNLEGNLFILKTSKNLNILYFWVHSTCWDQRGEVWSGENFMIVWCLRKGQSLEIPIPLEISFNIWTVILYLTLDNIVWTHLEFLHKHHWMCKSAYVTSKGVSNVLACYHVAPRRDNVWTGIFILSYNLASSCWIPPSTLTLISSIYMTLNLTSWNSCWLELLLF